MAVITSSRSGAVDGAGVPQSVFAAPASSRETAPGGFEDLVEYGAAGRAPSPELASRRYQAAASGYDLWTVAADVYRQRAVETLAPALGSVVLDVGCGTGLNFGRAGVGDRSARAPDRDRPQLGHARARASG